MREGECVAGEADPLLRLAISCRASHASCRPDKTICIVKEFFRDRTEEQAPEWSAPMSRQPAANF
jgi:hypothetical protein